MVLILLLSFCFASMNVFASDIKTNSLDIKNSPVWVTRGVVEQATDKIENKLEWKIQRVPVIWHASHETYSRAHSLGVQAVAVTVKSKSKTEVHIGPLVGKEDYEQILGHELVHVVFYQKYKGSIPDWLEEGFANFFSRKEKVDKTWLSKQKIPSDVTKMGHPYSGNKTDIFLQYKISQALVEMLDDKCDLAKLLRLSVQKKIETYIQNTCGIKNINSDFQAWLKKKAFKVVHQEKTKHYEIEVEEIQSGLNIPWGFEFLDENTILINEKDGRLSTFHLLEKKSTPIQGGPKVVDEGQGGSLDIKKHPQFPKVPWIYITYVEKVEGVDATQLARFQIKNHKVQSLQKLLASKGGTQTHIHFGSRLAFDDKGLLYVSIGERGHRPNAQDLSTHAGSVLRLKEDGGVPSDNPFVGREGVQPEIWSSGHRNPQGLVFDPKKRQLWEMEHGPRGGDEINLIEKGKNYGWPIISYGKEYDRPDPVGEATHKEGMEQPVHYYDPSIAPCGLDVYYGQVFPAWTGNLLAGALKLTHINRVVIRDEKFVEEERILKDFNQRIRTIKVGPEGRVYFSTDSGGIYRLVPKK